MEMSGVYMEQDLATEERKDSDFPLSAKQLKRQERYEIIKQKRKEKRKEVKARQKAAKQQENNSSERKAGNLSKREYKELTKQKLEDAFQHGVKIVINCAYETHMNQKEYCKLAGQIRRLYGANCKAKVPFHIYLTSMNEGGPLFKECARQNDGFLHYMLDRSSLPMEQIFSKDDIILLTPDSENVLSEIDPTRVYVINGLVDHQVLKGQSIQTATNLNLKSARLPISEYMKRVEGFKGNSSLALTVNQVFEILLDFHHSNDWATCLEKHIPKRKGWVLKKPDEELFQRTYSLDKSQVAMAQDKRS